jgi:hypothetical protein
MKHLLLLGCALGFSLLCPSSNGEAGCGRVVVQANVEVNDGEFSLADVLAPGVCSELRRVVALVPMGRAPLPGSARVFTGEEVRARFENELPLKDETASARWTFQVPDRITVRRFGARASCAEISGLIAGASSFSLMDAVAGSFLPAQSCGAAGGGILQDAAFAVAKTRWNPRQRIMEITARCLQPRDCTPFLVSERMDPSREALPEAAKRIRTGPSPLTKITMVRPGQKMTLLWDQDGIQVLLRVICLDRGDLGETVRARVQPGDRVLRATVVSAETLRMQR